MSKNLVVMFTTIVLFALTTNCMLYPNEKTVGKIMYTNNHDNDDEMDKSDGVDQRDKAAEIDAIVETDKSDEIDEIENSEWVNEPVSIDTQNDHLYYREERSDGGRVYVNLHYVITSVGFQFIDQTENSITYKNGQSNAQSSLQSNNQPEIIIIFDLAKHICYKNEFQFPIDNSIKQIGNETYLYIEKETIENILNIHITAENNVIETSPLTFTAHEWISFSDGLVAHAGGGISDTLNPSNSRQSVIYSYNNGHRLFELDLNLTTDGKLAVVHDWHAYSGMKSSDEWKQIKIWDVYTSMILEDVFDIMLVNKDMFLITDTKSFEYTQEQIEQQFQIIIETSIKKDPTRGLLNRIIPQIYNQPMYDTIMSLYDFKSVIYTLYASPDTDSAVLDFIVKHDNIRAVCMAPPRNKAAFVQDIWENERYVYLHTINDLQTIATYRKQGVWGIYTDFVFPSDKSLQAVPANTNIVFDGSNTALDAYNIGDNHYIRMSDLAYLFRDTANQFSIAQSDEDHSLSLVRGKSYMPVGIDMDEMTEKETVLDLVRKSYYPVLRRIIVDGEEIALTAVVIDNHDYFKLRDMADLLGFNVRWDNMIIIAGKEV